MISAVVMAVTPVVVEQAGIGSVRFHRLLK
jgi:hypothetical protein